jgi:ABC-2 type transport system ATP-binding protein
MIQVQGLTKRYGQMSAVDDLSFEVRPGRVTGFLGANGAGKSTTLRVIMGLDAPDAGRAIVNGQAYHDLGWPLREVGAHLDAKAFHPGRSAERGLLALAEANALEPSRVGAVLEWWNCRRSLTAEPAHSRRGWLRGSASVRPCSSTRA